MSNNATPWGGVIKIDKAPVEGDLLVGNADGSFALSSEISGDSLAPGSVTTSKIADGAVTTDKIPNDAITTAKLIDQGVIAAKLANGSVTAPKMPDGVITTTKIADGAITTGKIQANAITANLIAAEAIVTDKLAAGCIVTDKIQANAITAVTIKAKAIETEKIQIGAVVTDSIGLNAVSRVAADSSNTGSVSVTLTTIPGTSICILGLFNGVINTATTSGTLKIKVNTVEVDSVDIFADASASPVYQPLTPNPLYAADSFGGPTSWNFVPWAFSGNRNLYPRSIQYNYLVPNATTSATVEVIASVTSEVSVLVWGLQR